MTKLIDQCYLKAIKVLKGNSVSLGFKASARKYDSIWARDGSITVLGALLVDDKKFLDTSRLTLEILRNYQTPLGQIPDVLYLSRYSVSDDPLEIKEALFKQDEHREKEDLIYYSTDSSSWWIIGVEKYFSKTGDKEFLDKFWPSVKSAALWLKYQVIDNSGLVNSATAADWMDSSIGRRGKVFYINCLYYKAMESVVKLAEATEERYFDPFFYKNQNINNLGDLKERINFFFWPQEEEKGKEKKLLWTPHREFFDEIINSRREHYVDYFSFESYEDKCDVLANTLAILFEIADKDKQEKILKYFFEKKISNPYPVKVMNPPIFYPNPTWNPKVDLYRKKICQNIPFHYHNAGIWPYVGGLYILALVKAGEKKKAEQELEKLAEANKLGREVEWEFNEWLYSKTGEPMGAVHQTWSAAGYIIAYQAVVKGKLLF